MRRKERKSTHEDAISWLANCAYAVLCMTDENNNPYGVPISPVLEGDVVYFHCATKGLKLDCVLHHPEVCLVCADGVVPIPEKYTTAYQSVIAFGTATIVDDDEEKLHALRLITEKYASSHLDAFDDAIKRSFRATTLVKIQINKLSGKQNPLPEKQASV